MTQEEKALIKRHHDLRMEFMNTPPIYFCQFFRLMKELKKIGPEVEKLLATKDKEL